jgi:hypothetical protein
MIPTLFSRLARAISECLRMMVSASVWLCTDAASSLRFSKRSSVSSEIAVVSGCHARAPGRRNLPKSGRSAGSTKATERIPHYGLLLELGDVGRTMARRVSHQAGIDPYSCREPEDGKTRLSAIQGNSTIAGNSAKSGALRQVLPAIRRSGFRGD